MQESTPEKPIDLTVTTKQANTAAASASSFMMSPASEPDTTSEASKNAEQKIDHDEVDNQSIGNTSETREEVPEQLENQEKTSSEWDRCDMLYLLAAAAEMKAKSERKESSSLDDSDDEHSPLLIDEDACKDDEEEVESGHNSRKRKLSEHETGHAAISAVSAASIIESTRISAPPRKRASPQPYFRYLYDSLRFLIYKSFQVPKT